MKPILFLKALKNQAGYALWGNPPRWHKVGGDRGHAPDGAHHVAVSHYEVQAVKKLKADPAFKALPPDKQKHEVKALAVKMQSAASHSAAVSGWKKAALDGKNPTPAQWKAFYLLPKDKQAALLASLPSTAHLNAPAVPKADPEAAVTPEAGGGLKPEQIGESFEDAMALEDKIASGPGAAVDEINNAVFSQYDQKHVLKDADGNVTAAIAFGVSEAPGEHAVEIHHIGSTVKGGGKALLQVAKDYAAKQGLPIKLYAIPGAIGFYESQGFSHTGAKGENGSVMQWSPGAGPKAAAFQIKSVYEGNLLGEGSVYHLQASDFSGVEKALGLSPGSLAEPDSATYTVTDHKGRTFSVYKHGGALSVRASGENKDHASAQELLDHLKTANTPADDGPKEGDTKPAADGGTLVLKDGHWVKQGGDVPAVGKAAVSGTAPIVYLAVPFQDKDFAKKYGAKWDPDKKLWFAKKEADGTIYPGLEQFVPDLSVNTGKLSGHGGVKVSAAAANHTLKTGEQWTVGAKPVKGSGFLAYHVAHAETGEPADPYVGQQLEPAAKPTLQDVLALASLSDADKKAKLKEWAVALGGPDKLVAFLEQAKADAAKSGAGMAADALAADKPKPLPKAPAPAKAFKAGDVVSASSDIKQLPAGTVVSFTGNDGKPAKALIGKTGIWLSKKVGQGFQKNPLPPSSQVAFLTGNYAKDGGYKVEEVGPKHWLHPAQIDTARQLLSADAKSGGGKVPALLGSALILVNPDKGLAFWVGEKDGEWGAGFSASDQAKIQAGDYTLLDPDTFKPVGEPDDGPKEGDTKPAADGGVLVLKDGHWVKEGGDEPAAATPAAGSPVPAPADHAKLTEAFDALKLPESNSNHKTVNKQVDALKAAVLSGDAAKVAALKFGSNTYGKKLQAAQQKALQAMGAAHGAEAAHPAAATAAAEAVQAPAAAAPQPVVPTAVASQPMPAHVSPPDEITPEQEQALQSFVLSGGHLMPGSTHGIKPLWDSLTADQKEFVVEAATSALPGVGEKWEGFAEEYPLVKPMPGGKVALLPNGQVVRITADGTVASMPQGNLTALAAKFALLGSQSFPDLQSKWKAASDNGGWKALLVDNIGEAGGDVAAFLNQLHGGRPFDFDGNGAEPSIKSTVGGRPVSLVGGVWKNGNHAAAEAEAASATGAGDMGGWSFDDSSPNDMLTLESLNVGAIYLNPVDGSVAFFHDPDGEAPPFDAPNLKALLSDMKAAGHDLPPLAALQKLDASITEADLPGAEQPRPAPAKTAKQKLLASFKAGVSPDMALLKEYAQTGDGGLWQASVDAIKSSLGVAQSEAVDLFTYLLSTSTKIGQAEMPSAPTSSLVRPDHAYLQWIKKAVESGQDGDLKLYREQVAVSSFVPATKAALLAYADAGLQYLGEKNGEPGPKDGDTKMGVTGMLVFKDGHWHLLADSESAGDDGQTVEPAAQPAPAPAVGPKSGATKAVKKSATLMEHTEDGHSKFWAVSVHGNQMMVKYGKIGTKGQVKVKEFKSPVAAAIAASKLMTEKTDKGYKSAGVTSFTHRVPDDSAPAPAPAPSAAPPAATGGPEAIDGWAKVGGQEGYNDGAFYTDPSGQKWYCKFSSGGEDVAKSEMLALQLYAAAGCDVPHMKLVSMGGKVGTASRAIDGLKTDKAALQSGKAKGIFAGFAADAWLANWDTVGNNPAAGKGWDNIQFGPDGKAYRIDAGGALAHKGSGGKKSDAEWGDDVVEIKTLLDPKKNANTAKAFSGMTEADVKASVAKVLAVPDDKILSLCMKHAPGSGTQKKALADKLIARKKSLAKQFPDVAAKVGGHKSDVAAEDWVGLKPGEKVVESGEKFGVKWAKIEVPSAGFNAAGIPKPYAYDKSSSQFVNAANTADIKLIYDTAVSGAGPEAVEGLKFEEIDKATGAKTGQSVGIKDHKSQAWVATYHSSVLAELKAQLAPTYRMAQSGSFAGSYSQIAQGLAEVTQTVKNWDFSGWKDWAEDYLVLDRKAGDGIPQIEPGSFTDMESGDKRLLDFKQRSDAGYEKLTSAEKSAVKAYTGSAYWDWNAAMRKGDKSSKHFAAGAAMRKAFEKAAVELPEGVILHRGVGVGGDTYKSVVGAIIQDGSFQSTSFGSSAAFAGKTSQLRLHIGKGVKGMMATTFSNFGKHEREIILSPNCRYLVQKVDKVGGRHVVDILVLPHEG